MGSAAYLCVTLGRILHLSVAQFFSSIKWKILLTNRVDVKIELVQSFKAVRIVLETQK